MPTSRPNIILLTTDQQRGDCLGIDGHPVLQTPNLDYLARSGTFFRRGYSECPSCFPARRSLMSGMAPAAQGMVAMKADKEWRPPHTLAGELQRAGYQTRLVGKLHLQPKGKRFGFEHQELADNSLGPDNAYTRWLGEVHGLSEHDASSAHGVNPNGWVGRPSHLPEEQTHTYWCMSKALKFLEYERDPTAPFFLNISLIDPHPPLAPPRFYYDRYIQRDLPAPVVGDWADKWERPVRGLETDAWHMRIDPEQMRCCRAAYYGTINFIDDQVGRLIWRLRHSWLLDNTLILFTSDHGEMLGDHNLYRKCRPYEGSARVPFLIHAAKSMGCPEQIICNQPVGLQDVMPTLLEAAGVAVPPACTGKSLMPIVRGGQAEVRQVLHGEHAGQRDASDGMHYLVSERYKYVWYSQRPIERLFDLQADPGETRDLALRAERESLLAPWRAKMVEVLTNRPEGFVQEGKLVLGRTHRHFLPDYQADRFTQYL